MGMQRYSSDKQPTEIKFPKTGAEIRASIEAACHRISIDIAELQGRMLEVCNLREVSLQEVLEAEDNQEKVSAYYGKMSGSRGQSQSRMALEELQKDLEFLRTSSLAVARKRGDIDDLQRVHNNVDPGGRFELAYYELVWFGF